MKKKILSILVCVIMVIGALIFNVPDEMNVKASGESGENNDNMLNCSYIRSIIENLSDVIFDAPPDYGTQKGREFGTTGERFAAETIVAYEMDRLGLWNPNLDPPYLENMEDIETTCIAGNLTHKLETLSDGITVNHSGTPTELVDFYISPRWNETFREEYGPFGKKCLFDYDETLLTHNFSHNGLKVYRRPSFPWLGTIIVNLLKDVLNKGLDKAVVNKTLYDYGTFASFIMEQMQEAYEFSFNNTDEIGPQNQSLPWYNETFAGISDDFVLIDVDPFYNPNESIFIFYQILKEINPLLDSSLFFPKMIRQIQMQIFHCLPGDHCKGLILYDFNNDTYDMVYMQHMALPVLFINKTVGEEINEDPGEYTIDYHINQRYNKSANSSNVIGQINGSDPSKTIIVCSLYDSWRCQGATDSATAIGIMLGIAKYMKELQEEYDITPKYNVKFIAFCAEEYGYRGAYYYNKSHEDEDIVAVIDLNQLGYDQRDPDIRQSLYLAANKLLFCPILNKIIEDSNYVQRMKNTVDIKLLWNPAGAPSNDKPFSERTTWTEPFGGPETVCFLKGMYWTRHHRDGLNHTMGDTMDYINWTDVNLTSEIVWNVTKYHAIYPDCWFNGNLSYETVDSPNDDDSDNDSINITFTINTSLPNDLVMVKAILKGPLGFPYLSKTVDYVIKNNCINATFTITLPPTASEGNYSIEIELFNSTERINYKTSFLKSGDANDSDQPDSSFHLHPRGNRRPNKPEKPSGPTTVNAGEEYVWTTSATDPDGDQLRYEWAWRADIECEWLQDREIIKRTFDSEETAWASHVYHFPGEIEIMVRAIDYYGAMSEWSIWKEYGDRGNWSDTLSVESSMAVSFEMSSNPLVMDDHPLQTVVNYDTQFYSQVFDIIGDCNYSWNFNGMKYAQSYQQNPVYKYTTAGNYTVNLTVTDENGFSANHSEVVSVVDLKADFNKSINFSVEPYETIFFNDSSIGVYNLSNWTWDFGDGSVSYDRNASHEYKDTGLDEYNVTLTVTDNESNSDVFSSIVSLTYDFIPPRIHFVSDELIHKSNGFNVSVIAKVIDTGRGVDTVKANITSPIGSTCGNFTLNHIFNNTYCGMFNDTWKSGNYSYTVWSVDNDNNSNSSSGFLFTVPPVSGYVELGNNSQSVEDRIVGSVFTMNEFGTADSITCVHPEGEITVFPPGSPRMKCMIFRANDSSLIGTTEEKIGMSSVFNFSEPKPVLEKDTEYFLTVWGNNSNARVYYDVCDDERGRHLNLSYNCSFWPNPMLWVNESRLYSIYCSFTPEQVPPEICNVSVCPDVVGFGDNITITADVTDTKSGVDKVCVNVTYPDSSDQSFIMTNIGDDTYQYVFSDTWLVGQYNYTIWAVDTYQNENFSSNHSFNVSAYANISVCTIKDEFGAGEAINLTDPPGGDSFNIGYELLDDGGVLHIWNKYDSYYFDTNSGIQLTNHYDEYWSHNVLMLGYYNNDQWNLIYRTDELSGFNKNIESDNETFVNATLWKDLSYGGYDFRLAIRYYLGVNDNELTVIPYIKNIDTQDIPYILGFGWELNDIMVDMTETGDYIEVDNESYLLNQSLDNSYTNLSDPAFYILENITETTSESLYMRWDKDLSYALRVKSRAGQYNAPVTLFVRIGVLDVGQEKSTEMFWYDASKVTYYFNRYDTEGGEEWSTNPGYMVDGDTRNFASTSISDDVELCDDNTYNSGGSGVISKVELRALTYYQGVGWGYVNLVPVFDGSSDGDNHQISCSGSATWSKWMDITSDTNAPGSWSWSDIESLDCDVVSDVVSGDVYCSKVEIQVTYTPNTTPGISNPSPADDSINISISPTLSIDVYDAEADSMDISWLSNSSGSWQVFGTNNSVHSGTYYQVMVNASVNGGWWYWKVNVSDGTEYNESDVFRFYTGVQSKIVNSGDTNISGYLLIQVQYYNDTLYEWFVDNDTINETTTRTINSGCQLGLDTIFNGLVDTDDLTFGDGTYRVYASFRDPDGDVLICDDASKMEAWWEFIVDTS
jgi:hypothetical protein